MSVSKNLILTLALLAVFSSSSLYAASQTANVRDITLRYCNGTGAVTKSLLINTKSSQKESLCLEFSNEGFSAATIGLNFVDGTLTADTDQKKACQPEGTKEQFGKYVTWFENRFTIPARSKKRVFASLEFPEWYAGTSYGCATYFLADDPGQTIKNEWQVFTIFARVWSFIDAFVDGKIHPELIMLPVQGDWFVDKWSNSTFVIYREWFWNYKIRGNIYNTGNVAVSGAVTVGWSSWWGLVGSSITYPDQQVLPRQSTLVDVKIPAYMVWFWGAKVKTTLAVNYKPIFLWAHNTKANDTTVYTLTTDNSKWFFPWVVFVLLLWAMVVRVIIKKLMTIILTRRQSKKPVKKSSSRKPSSRKIASKEVAVSKPVKKSVKKPTSKKS